MTIVNKTHEVPMVTELFGVPITPSPAITEVTTEKDNGTPMTTDKDNEGFPSPDPVLYAAQHPDMSEALLIDGNTAHSTRMILNMAAMTILREYDEMLPVDEWLVMPVPASTEQGLDLFHEDRNQWGYEQ